MVSLQTTINQQQAPPSKPSNEPNSSPRISFSEEFAQKMGFTSITTKKSSEKKGRAQEFEFVSSHNKNDNDMITADELFFEGKLLPFWQITQSDRLNKLSLSTKDDKQKQQQEQHHEGGEPKGSNWYIDDDPSPKPPTCSVLWKELLRLKKQRDSSLSPSSSTSSSSSSSSVIAASADVVSKEKGKSKNKEKNVKRIKKGSLERSKSGNIRIRPMINVPICTQVKKSTFPPLFPIKKGKLVSMDA